MAKKKKKPQRKQGHPAKVNANVMSLAHAKVKRGLDALTPDYVRWYEQTYQGTGAVEMDLMAVRDSLSFYADLVGLDSVTDFDPQAIVAIVHGLVEREEHREDQKHLGMILSEAWISYSLFLEESDSGSITPESWRCCAKACTARSFRSTGVLESAGSSRKKPS